MTNKINDRIITLLGRLALAKSITQDVSIDLQDLLDGHDLKRVEYDEKTVKTINGVMHELDYSESTIDGVIYDVATELFKELADDATTDH
jgi:hypothetical protein